MISKTCDRCERVIEAEDNRAGQKINCPYCGDTNVLPASPEKNPAELEPHTEPHRQTPEALGYPPDHGPEQRVMIVRPAVFRSRPITFVAMILIAAAGFVLGMIAWISPATVPLWVGVVAAVACIGAAGLLLAWWIASRAAALEITNKRTIEIKGLFSRSTSEVLHDNIRNVQVEQTFWQRIWSVGKIGISSSGQDGIEIQMDRVPTPQHLQKVIDLYRPLD